MADIPSSPEFSASEETTKIDLKVIVYAVARSRWWVLGAALLGGILGLLQAARTPNTYVSQAKLLLLIGEREKITPEAVAGIGEGTPSRDSLPTVRDELHMLGDTAVYENAARAIGPEKILNPPDPTEHDDDTTPLHVRWMHQLQARLRSTPGEGQALDPQRATLLAAKALQRNTRVGTEPGSHVLLVTHTTTSPRRAREFTEALVEAFIQRHRDQFTILPYLEEHRGKVDAAQKERDAATSAYFEHQGSCGFIDLETQGPVLLASIETLSAQLFTAMDENEAALVEKEEQQARLDKLPEEIDEVVPAVTRSSLEYQEHFDLLSQLLADRQRLGVQGLSLTERSRREEEYDAEIARVEAKLDTLDPLVIEVPEIHRKLPNRAYQELDARIHELHVKRLVLEGTISRIESRLAEKRTALEVLRQCEREHEALIAARKEAQTRFEHLFEHFSTLEALASIDVEGETNLRVLQEPTLNPGKIGPSRSKILLLGVFAGVMLGTALAVLRHLLDPRIRYPQTVQNLLDLPMLGVVPRTKVTRQIARSR